MITENYVNNTHNNSSDKNLVFLFLSYCVQKPYFTLQQKNVASFFIENKLIFSSHGIKIM